MAWRLCALIRPRVIAQSVPLSLPLRTSPARVALYTSMPLRRSTRSTRATRPADDQPAPDAPPSKKPRVSLPPADFKEAPEPGKQATTAEAPANKPSTSPAARKVGAPQPKKRVSRASKVDSDCPAAPTAAFHAAYGDNLSAEDLPRTSLDLTKLPVPYDGPAALEQMGIQPRVSGDSRIAVWNIVSFRSSDKKGMFSYLKAEDADVVVLLETKVNEVPMMHPGFGKWPHRAWAIDPTKKGYAGVAVWSKAKPIMTTIGIPASVIGKHATADDETGSSSEKKSKLYDGRVITLELENSFVVGYYAPNAGEGLKRIDGKMQWFTDLTKWLQHLRKKDASKPIIMTGDLNVVLDERDVSMGSNKWNKAPGFTEAECSSWRRMVQPPPKSDTLVTTEDEAEEGASKVYTVPENAEKEDPFPFVDVWRQLHPDAVGHFCTFTSLHSFMRGTDNLLAFFGMRGMCRPKGIGWRLDSFLVSNSQYEHVGGTEAAPASDKPRVPIRSCEIRYPVYGTSDHVPVVLDVAGPL